MRLQKGRRFLINISLALAVQSCHFVSGQEVESACVAKGSEIEEIRNHILSGEVDSLLPRINFPLEIFANGYRQDAAADFVLNFMWPSISTPDFLVKVETADACDLAKELQLDNEGKIHTLALFVDEEDAKYGYSAIRSARELKAFFVRVKELAAARNYADIAMVVRFPFAIYVNDVRTVVTDEAEFVSYGDLLFNDLALASLIDQSIDGSNYELRVNGIMLHPRGDVWVHAINKGELQLVIQGFGDKRVYPPDSATRGAP